MCLQNTWKEQDKYTLHSGKWRILVNCCSKTENYKASSKNMARKGLEVLFMRKCTLSFISSSMYSKDKALLMLSFRGRAALLLLHSCPMHLTEMCMYSVAYRQTHHEPGQELTQIKGDRERQQQTASTGLLKPAQHLKVMFCYSLILPSPSHGVLREPKCLTQGHASS